MRLLLRLVLARPGVVAGRLMISVKGLHLRRVMGNCCGTGRQVLRLQHCRRRAREQGCNKQEYDGRETHALLLRMLCGKEKASFAGGSPGRCLHARLQALCAVQTLAAHASIR